MAVKVLVNNKRAYFEYFVLETYETGIVLTGAEVKSVRAGKINISDAFVYIEGGTPILRNAHISPYEKGSFFNSEAKRDRILLLNRAEITKIFATIREKGLTVVPLKVYLSGSLIKLEIGVVQGKKLYDKRETLKRKVADREADRAMRGLE